MHGRRNTGTTSAVLNDVRRVAGERGEDGKRQGKGEERENVRMRKRGRGRASGSGRG